MEPAEWHYPVREALGGALLRQGMPCDAEAVFRGPGEKSAQWTFAVWPAGGTQGPEEISQYGLGEEGIH